MEIKAVIASQLAHGFRFMPKAANRPMLLSY